ncbi:hypothetical protein ACFSFY_02485 [Sporosarcina siberiensis]|uniref:Uncharacterized protein n=1 Tax=Sporosarcina siberiensis TaxID=1365606 RepID=A0ABW4SC84_9BACL
MGTEVYYSTTEVKRIVGVNITATKEIAGVVSEIITSFGAKERGAWRFTRKEMCFIKFVSAITTREHKQDAAIVEALDYFYGIDHIRNY